MIAEASLLLQSYITVEDDTFISWLMRHILDKYFPMICWCGLFANRWEKQYLALKARLWLIFTEISMENWFELILKS